MNLVVSIRLLVYAYRLSVLLHPEDIQLYTHKHFSKLLRWVGVQYLVWGHRVLLAEEVWEPLPEYKTLINIDKELAGGIAFRLRNHETYGTIGYIWRHYIWWKVKARFR